MYKIKNIHKQYGTFYIIKALFKRLLSPVMKFTSFYVVAVENHTPNEISKEIKIVNENNLDDFIDANTNINENLRRQLFSFLPNNSIAILVFRDGQIAGWGFVQNSGHSKYGGYDFYIPRGTQIIKNLYVEPKFRGQSIGKKINEERLNCIPEGAIPIGLVIPSNTYAIRNLEMYGFTKQVYVKDYLWFNKFHKRSLKVIGKENVAKVIIPGFNDE